MLHLIATNNLGARILQMSVADVIQQGRACDLLRQRGNLAEVQLRLSPSFELPGTASIAALAIEAPLIVAQAALGLMLEQSKAHAFADIPPSQRRRLVIDLSDLADAGESGTQLGSTLPVSGAASGKSMAVGLSIYPAVLAFWQQWGRDQQNLLTGHGLSQAAGDINVQVITGLAGAE